MIIDKLKYLNSLRIILASGSPRRKALLTQINMKFEVIPSTFPEDLDKSKYTPSQYVEENAKQKALQVFESECKENESNKPDLVIGSDTVVVFNDKILEKPKDVNNAKEMLTSLSNATHTVVSGVALINKNKDIHKFVQTTKVKFGKITPQMIDSYIDTKEPMDKAGGYGMQAIAGQFIIGIEGCYFNVVGFPLQLFCNELRTFLKLDDVKSAAKETKTDENENKKPEDDEMYNGKKIGEEPPAKKQRTNE
eukprot:CAMPEP_0201566376 /NCGR_PEP_ID=MMETSP0190_2-20130828/6121_1 /ASSEMBLY_ACC=CAM_ASM_000263 /TAXON_ID=37353 /ORGANISM="Rosalina sp." /LENGTH=250 /DNA_ID=CAMNT_0047984999 /DNA_START=21 /DNA_END=773 /DNA_ORIENTATION=+